MQKILLVMLLVMTCRCSLFQTKKEPVVIKYPAELQAVHSLILEKKTADARIKVDDYLNKAENIHWYGHAYFLKGFLYELDENYPKSIKHYRSAIQHGSSYESKVEAKALYNLSFVYERVENMSELLISLVDLMKRRGFFDILTGQVEIPARLAAAYASQGRLKEAKIFHREAAQNFKTLARNQRFRSKKEEISKSLYYLGFASFDQNQESFDDLVKKLSIGQKYFLASAEASKSTWSIKATGRLNNLYTRAWSMVTEYKPKGFDNDPLAYKKQQHMRQLVMASDLYDLMHRVRAEEFPMSNVNPRSKEIIDKTSDWIRRIESFAMKLNLGPETVRNKKIKNKKLSLYVEEKVKKVKVNKEAVVPASKKEKTKTPPLPGKSAPVEIGKDPNL